MKTYGRVEAQLHSFLTSALDGSQWSASRPGHFTPEIRASGTYWIGDWGEGPEACLDAVAERKIPILCQ